MANSTDQEERQSDIYWKLLEDCIQRLGELDLSDKLHFPEKNNIVDAWEEIRKWRSNEVPQNFREPLIYLYQEKVFKIEAEAGIVLEGKDIELHKQIQSEMKPLDYQLLLDRCVQSFGEQKVSYWSLIEWKEIHQWHLEGVPSHGREAVIGLQDQVLTGLEIELKDDNKEETIETVIDHLDSAKAELEKIAESSRPKLQLYREAYTSFYEDIPEQDVAAIFAAEEEMANSNLIIGQQIYRVRTILTVYSQRKFLEWLKGICCKICNISWRKAYDLMYAYESRRYVEQNQPELLPVFDYQIQRFQCEARRYKANLVPILEEAQESRTRYTLEEVRDLFPPGKEKPPEEPDVSELRMSLKKLLNESLVSDLRHYIQTHPGETFQSILEVALRSWLIQQHP